MKFVTNMYEGSGDWSSYLQWIGVMKFNKYNILDKANNDLVMV